MKRKEYGAWGRMMDALPALLHRPGGSGGEMSGETMRGRVGVTGGGCDGEIGSEERDER